MDEHYRKHIARIKKIGESAKRRVEIYSELASLDDKGTARSLGALQRAPAPGKKLQKIGFILFWIPEPLMITNAVAVPMIIAGKYLDKVYNGSTISDVGHETRNMVGTLNDIKEHIK
ncbi:MAG: hypothetical protein E6L00_01685 [Thaumarchaeota archaeon]|nr:MAG: hypothetical protein E6L02_05685 [Nitrososphaerota archaeon]TLX83180.1 MAG: hypothetical protein E6L00_01685 [Nitrososphaerota archaeon]